MATRKQLQKLTVLYELTRAVTSILDLEELLRKTAGISRMLSARGCIIRLVEGDGSVSSRVLVFHGGSRMKWSLPLATASPAGSHRRASLLVEDVSKMPDDMRVPKLDVRTVICVPLKLGDMVIGTLGLYDRIDAGGDPVPFDLEDLNTAEGFAGITAIAIEKSKLYETEVMRQRQSSEEKKRLDILFDSVQGGIISLAKDYMIISANRYIEDWASMASDDLVGHSSIDIFHDKIGICPHCAAKADLRNRRDKYYHAIKGMNYAELIVISGQERRRGRSQNVLFSCRILRNGCSIRRRRSVSTGKSYRPRNISKHHR